MIDIDNVIKDHVAAVDKVGFEKATQLTALTILVSINNNLERLANTQEALLKSGQEATAKADGMLSTAMSLMNSLKV